MKKSIGPQLALYPMPITVIGAMNGSKPTWTLVAHVGAIGHDRVLVSLASMHFINGHIKKARSLSVNLVNEAILSKADFSGAVSGTDMDKSELFLYELGRSGSPIIQEAPLTMECSVEYIYPSPNFENFICVIENTFVEEQYISQAGGIDYSAMAPILFANPSYEYLSTGRTIGRCLSFLHNPAVDRTLNMPT